MSAIKEFDCFNTDIVFFFHEMEIKITVTEEDFKNVLLTLIG